MVFATLNAPPTSVISSFGGTTAMVPVALTFALSSLSACEPEVPDAKVVSGAVNAVHPFAGSTKLASSRSSLPFPMGVVPPLAVAAALAAVSWAVWPFALIRYVLITLSLWSWSIRPKLRTVSHGWPSAAVPAGGTWSLPIAISKLASR